MSDQAVKLAISGRWQDAATLNRDYVRLFADDPEGFNRLGKALAELGNTDEARNCYRQALERDPTNTIARRNLDRLTSVRGKSEAASAPPTQLNTKLFIEESGKASVATLKAVDGQKAALLDPGDIVELRAQGNAVNVHTVVGDYIGMVEPRIGLRLARMMGGGNRYSAAMVSTTGDFRVMIRETFQHPTQIGKVSFPQARTTEVRAYTRRGLLRGEQEVEYGEDDEAEEEEAEEGWSETSEETDTGLDVDVASDDESFD
jgi:tetratricopeptide (TPR) repeat protein